MSPQRVRVQGDLFHGSIPDGAVYIGRRAPGLRQSPFHNPFKVGRPVPPEYGTGLVTDAAHAVALYATYARRTPGFLDRMVVELRGRDLACWCRLDSPCHVDHALVAANSPSFAALIGGVR